MKKERAVPLILSVALALCLVGCGATNEQNDSTVEESQSEEDYGAIANGPSNEVDALCGKIFNVNSKEKEITQFSPVPNEDGNIVYLASITGKDGTDAGTCLVDPAGGFLFDARLFPSNVEEYARAALSGIGQTEDKIDFIMDNVFIVQGYNTYTVYDSSGYRVFSYMAANDETGVRCYLYALPGENYTDYNEGHFEVRNLA